MELCLCDLFVVVDAREERAIVLLMIGRLALCEIVVHDVRAGVLYYF